MSRSLAAETCGRSRPLVRAGGVAPRHIYNEDFTMNYLISVLNQTIAGKRELTIIHKTRGKILICPLKVDKESLIADIVKVDRLGDSPEKDVCLGLKDISLPRV